MNQGETGSKPAKIDSSQEERVRNTAMRMFTLSVLDLSWQMAIVVLVPIIGGYELDKHLHSTPWLTITGFIIAMLGTFVVLRRVLKTYSSRSAAAEITGKQAK